MTHPKDIEYIRTMLPNISQDVIEKQKVLQPGNCVGFGSAFKLPMIIKLEMPNPMPYSTNCDVSARWRVNVRPTTQAAANPSMPKYATTNNVN